MSKSTGQRPPARPSKARQRPDEHARPPRTDAPYRAERRDEGPRRERERPSADNPWATAKPQPTATRAEIKYHGAAACLALWHARPQEVIRAYVEESRVNDYGELLRGLATNRKAYHLVKADDLERLTDTVHHQGICLLALEHPRLDLAGLMREIGRRGAGPQLMLYLDGVENPHNLGAILRSCAHFGIRYVLGEAGRMPRLSASAVRVAEGGAESATLVDLDDPVAAVGRLREAGYQIVGTAISKGNSLYRHHFNPRTLLVMGAETVGMSGELAQQTDAMLRIPGTGAVESLNVSVAAALLLGEFYRQMGERRPRR